MRRMFWVAATATLLAACGGGDEPAGVPDVDNSVTEAISEETSCEKLLEDVESRREDLQRQAEDPGYMSGEQAELMAERVEAAEARIDELNC